MNLKLFKEKQYKKNQREKIPMPHLSIGESRCEHLKILGISLHT